MDWKTQMMKIGRPELFYLFRRAFGLFSLFVFNFYCHAQITVTGDVEIIDRTDHSPITIASGTYIFDSGNSDISKKKKSLQKLRKIISKANKKVKFSSITKVKSTNKKIDYQYFPKEDVNNFFSTPTTKTTCPSTNNLNNKSSHLLATWTLVQTLLRPVEKTNLFNFNYSPDCHLNSQRVRPPPDFI